jgi:hypothetical protein
MRKCLVAVLLVVLSPAVRAQAPAGWHDDLVDHLLGPWTLNGQVMGRDAHHDVVADWVLDHQFLRIHEKTSAGAPASERPYEAIWFLGHDDIKQRYVLLLVDVFGARYSETIGYGTREGDAIRFIFEYPDGLFYTTFRWVPETSSWQWLLEQKDPTGKWKTFADLKLARAAAKP